MSNIDFKPVYCDSAFTSIEVAKIGDSMYMLNYSHSITGTKLKCVLLLLCKVRTHKKCASTDTDLKGKMAYRPMTNSYHRGLRLDAEVIDNLFK